MLMSTYMKIGTMNPHNKRKYNNWFNTLQNPNGDLQDEIAWLRKSKSPLLKILHNWFSQLNFKPPMAFTYSLLVIWKERSVLSVMYVIEKPSSPPTKNTFLQREQCISPERVRTVPSWKCIASVSLPTFFKNKNHTHKKGKGRGEDPGTGQQANLAFFKKWLYSEIPK